MKGSIVRTAGILRPTGSHLFHCNIAQQEIVLCKKQRTIDHVCSCALALIRAPMTTREYESKSIYSPVSQ